VLLLAAGTPQSSWAATGLSVGALNFGKALYFGQGSTVSQVKTKTAAISNRAGGAPISGLQVQNPTGPASGDFQIQSNNCLTDLPAGANCMVKVTFTPTFKGPRNATLVISDSLNATAAQVHLKGIGVAGKHLNLPPLVNFGKVQVGKSLTKTVTLTNPNPLAVSIQSILASGPYTAKSIDCGASLGAGASCKVSVTFTPIAECQTLETGVLSVANETSSTPQQTKLSGIAVTPATPAIFVTNSGSNAVTAYPPSSAGDAAPIVAFGDLYGLNPYAVAVDSNENIYVTSLDGSMRVYATCANGSVTPTATIKGPNTELSEPEGIALDTSGRNIYVANTTGGPSGLGSITIYPVLSNGDATPSATIEGVNTGLNNPQGITLDSGGRIYVTNHDSVTIYPSLGSSTGSLNLTPIATITGTNTGLAFPDGIAVDSAGSIYVANFSGGVTVYPAAAVTGGGGDVMPIATITGLHTGIDGAAGIVLDSIRNVYVLNYYGISVTVYSAEAVASGGGDVMPIATIAGTNTELDQPEKIAMDSHGSSYVTNFSGGPSGLGAVTVYQPLGSSMGLLDESPATSFSAANTGISSPNGIAQDSKGNVYVENSLGPTGFGSVAIYAKAAFADSQGKVTPIATISGVNTGLNLPQGIALDSADYIYVLNCGCSGPSPGPSITVYPPIGSSTGTLNELPVATIAGPNTELQNGSARIAVNSKGYLFVANAFSGPSTFGSITVFPPLTVSSGLPNEAPISTITGSDTGLSFPLGIAFDSKGNIYVMNSGKEEGLGGPPSVTVYSEAEVANGGGNVTPLATITGANTEITRPTGIALDSADEVYVVNAGSPVGGIDSVMKYPAGSNGDVAPIAVINGSKTKLNDPTGIAIGSLVP